jgi:hypothetical protein
MSPTVIGIVQRVNQLPASFLKQNEMLPGYKVEL